MSKNDQHLASQQEDSIQLEDLFELKRLEKPNADFWEGFDAQLQQKILHSAIDQRNVIQRGWDLVSTKFLPVSAIATAAAAVAFSFAPLLKQTASTPSTPEAPAIHMQEGDIASSVTLAEDVDFHEVALSATEGLGEAASAQQFIVSDLSQDAQGNQIYATNALAVPASLATPTFGEQIF